MKYFPFPLILCLLAIPASAQVIRQRLIARTTSYDAMQQGRTWKMADSVVLKYSSGRGSQFDWNTMDYFDPAMLGNGASIVRNQSQIPEPNNIDSFGNAIAIRFDSLWCYHATQTGGPRLACIETYVYNPDGKPRTGTYFEFGTLSNPGYRLKLIEDYSYGNGRFSAIDYSIESNAQPNQATGRRWFIRNSAGKILMDTSQNTASPSAPFTIARYLYDQSGRYISRFTAQWDGPMQEYPYRREYEYYPNGLVKKIQHIMAPTANDPMVNEGVETFEYTPGVEGYTKLIAYYLDGGNIPTESRRVTAHVNAAGLKDTLIQTIVGDPYQLYSAIEYNSFGNPVSVTEFTRDAIGVRQNVQKRSYYYESYQASLNVPSAPAAASDVTIYPNPTDGSFRLRFNNGVPQGQLAISVTNAAGVLIQSSKLKLDGNLAQVVLPGDAPAGVYFVRVTNEAGSQLYTGSVLKR